MRWIAILLFCLVESALRVSARYALSVRVHKFINPGNQDFNGGCCDTTCGNDCDIYFIFCLRPKDYPTASNFCPSGQFSTAGHHVSDDDIDFTIGTNLAPGVPNPLVYTGNTWSGGFQLLVRVFDNDADADDLIDEIFVNRDLAANGVYVGRQTYSDGVGSASIDLDFQASCTNNYYGPQCNVFCATVDDATGHYTCNTAGERICIEGWQDLPNCLTPECADGCHPDGGFCETAGGCMCNTGWSGDLCDQCTPATGCVHGYCNIPEDCICEVDYSGTLCNQDDDVCGHQAPCQNGATCSNLGPDDYECQCAAGYTDSDCQTEIDECQPTNPCQNGGVCMDLVAGFECQCATGWDGPTCEVNINECVPISPCQNGATCQDCEPTGPSIGGVSDPIVDECPIGYICDCPDGYYGDDCEVDIDYCESDPCMNGARCVDMLTEFVCECLAGYTGEDCGAEINECDSNPCLFGGSCMDQLANYTCSCVPGFTGDNCGTNIDDCAGNNCTENSHTCVDGIDSYECQCHPGYTGEFCETNINDCDPSPCLEGSTCTDLVNDFMCECLPGYTGPLCSENIDDCEPNPCLNDGQCDDGIQSYTCTCQPGWTGTQCETQLPFPCESDPCGPNMVCFDEGPTSYYCEPCTPGGEGCSEVSVNNTDTQEGGGGGLDGAGIGAIIGGVIGALLLFLLLLLLCCCCMRWFACCCFAPATKEDEVEVRYDAWKDGAVNVNPTYFGPNTLLRDGTMGSHAGDSLTRRSGPVNVQNPMYATPTLQRPQEGGINHQNPMYAFSANGTRSPPPLPPPRTGSQDPLLKNSPPLYDDLHPYEPIPGQRKGTTSPLVVSTGNHYQHLSDSTEGTPMVLASGKYDQLKVSAETPPVLASGKYNHLGEDSTARPQSKSMENVYIANPTQPNIVLPGAIPDPEEEKNPGKDDITNAEIPSSTENPYDTC